MDEEHHAIGSRTTAQHRAGEHHFAHVKLRVLAVEPRRRGLHAHVVVHRDEPQAVVTECGGCRAGHRRQRSTNNVRRMVAPRSAAPDLGEGGRTITLR